MKISQITNSFSKKMGGAEKLVNMIHCHLRENDMHSFVLGILIDNDNTLPDSTSIGLNTPYDIRAFFSIKRYCKNNIECCCTSPSSSSLSHQYFASDATHKITSDYKT